MPVDPRGDHTGRVTAWLKDRDDPAKKAAALASLDRAGPLVIYLDTRGYICSTRAFQYRPVAGPGVPAVPHPAPPRGEIAVVPVPQPIRIEPSADGPRTAADALG